MATIFDGDNLLITLTAGGAAHTVDAEADLYSEWKRWVNIDVGGSSKYPPAFRTTGGDPLTTGITAGAYFFVRNDLGWRIKPAEEDSTITLVGNLAPQDSAVPVFEPTTGAFTVAILGLQPITQNVDQILENQQSASFDGVISVDTIDGALGTDYPIGTRSQPVKLLSDALIIASREGIKSLLVRGSIVLSQSFVGWDFSGRSAHENCVIDMNGQSVDQSKFERVELTGSGSGEIDVISSSIDAVSGVHGVFHDCGIDNSLTLGAGGSSLHFCYSQLAGTGKPEISLNGQLSTLGVRGWVGGLKVSGVSNASAAVSIDVLAGRLELTASCTAGDIVVGSPGAQLTDNSAGSNVLKDSWVDSIDQARIVKATVWRQYTNPSTGNLDIYDDADALDQSVPIYEDDGVTSWDGAGPIVRRNKIT